MQKETIRRRNIRVTLRLSPEEFEKLAQVATRSGLSRMAYLRMLIAGYVPKEKPPPDYYRMMKELHAIGTNLNQLAACANSQHWTKASDAEYEENANALFRAILAIQAAVTLPEKR